MREGGSILAKILRELSLYVRSGITTGQINDLAEDLIRKEGVEPAFKGYHGYPASVCTSVNDEVVHGIPGSRKLIEGDIVSLDFGIRHAGFFSDSAVTVAVGNVDSESIRLIESTRSALEAGIARAVSGNHLFDIAWAIQKFVQDSGYSVVRQFVGHGIGKELHEDPEVPNYGTPHRGPLLKNGMVLAIEPMVNLGTWECEILGDGWTAVTKDKKRSAHFEHTVAITEAGPEVLTQA